MFLLSRQQGCSFLEATPSSTFGPTPICHMKSIRSGRVFAFLQSASEKTSAVQHQKCFNCVFGASNDCICTSCDHDTTSGFHARIHFAQTKRRRGGLGEEATRNHLHRRLRRVNPEMCAMVNKRLC